MKRGILLMVLGVLGTICVLLMIGGDVVASLGQCHDSSNGVDHWYCNSEKVDGYGLRINNLRYRTSTSGTPSTQNTYKVSYWEHSAWLMIGEKVRTLQRYDYNGVGEDLSAGSITQQYSGGCTFISITLTGSIDSKSFEWEQEFRACDIESQDYASWEDTIEFPQDPQKDYWVTIHHRSWAEITEYDNDFYVYKLDPTSATYQDPQSELLFSAKNVDGNGNKIKVEDKDNDYRLYYEPFPDQIYSYGDYRILYMINIRQNGATKSDPIWAITAEDTSYSRSDVWWIWRDKIDKGSDHTLEYAESYLKPDENAWPG